MGTLINNIVKGNTDINDEVIAGNMIGSATSAADAYLAATLTSSTPELRALYSTSLNGIIGGHSALTALAVNRGWATPYNKPSQQLADTCKKSETTVDNK
ncbi:spore coat protein [Clostridium estertheticum]|uniref:Spore coat protein n=1 Tax=Clostridium estertheticum TaxID=238834 RepID=A0A5N7J7H1_9CLOT|nr:spore coat protein [Clostridium estertheticum]MBU3171736.1 spore coat protein [Clostridium estertheticum]MBW9172751.1 spore coat protein [Clostridium estertheticum]MCB2356501.1 spore coat protein [Clostridium estertheticum]MPQ34232.1 spore coat protein [Clostridium estertheticum]MPQ64655.1 spore coat protein [Clostridium estertheticum]